MNFKHNRTMSYSEKLTEELHRIVDKERKTIEDKRQNCLPSAAPNISLGFNAKLLWPPIKWKLEYSPSK